ncbi:uncharacterized protein LOC142977733 [Anticarsia gemmatalis]|uniref:uncharacterized protein LOC142977733 n=1 Tax=Anticarsia gemmatalis TaxID=129554 RepID=UPI003F7642CE
MKICSLLFLFLQYTARAELTVPEDDFATRRINMIVDIIIANFKTNGWSTILCFGSLPDQFYIRLQNISHPFAITNLDREDDEIEDVVRYYSNFIIINLIDVEEYEDTLSKVRSSPYWHPHANLILYYHQKDREILPKIYFSLWYYKAINAIIVQYDDTEEVLLISHYTPYISDSYKLDHLYGCRTTRRIGMPVTGFEQGFICEEKCHNVSLHSKFRANHLGTCIGFSTIVVPYNASKILPTLNILFEDKSKDFHGFMFRAFTTEVEPFFRIRDHRNGSYTLYSRDGSIWNAMSKLMNFSIDLTPSVNVLFEPFNFELNIKQIFDFAYRKADLYLIPIYLFDIVVVEVDFTFPYTGSGVCIMSKRAGFETTLFDSKAIHANRSIIIQFILCFLGIWFIFSIYQFVERRRLTNDQIGKDLLNALRNVLLITLCNPPSSRSFRLFLTISIWSFFVLNFISQATIISFLTAVKRGKDVQTFEDMIDKGYLIYGMASPDLILPDTEERFRIINSRLVSVQDLFGCVRNISYDSHRFCLIDCSVGRYVERNRLNEHGQQYLHIAKDKMHSHYLSLLLTKHSPLTIRFDKYLLTFFEAGLIKKWERYRYTDIKEEAPTKPLGMTDFLSLFNAYGSCLGFISFVFLLELLIFNLMKVSKFCLLKKNKNRSD